LNYEYLRLAEDASVVDLQAARETLIGLDTDPHGLWFKTNWLAGQNRFAESYTIGMEAIVGLRPKSDHQLDWNNYLNLLQSLIAWTSNPDFSLSEAEQKNLVEQMDDGQPSTKSLILQTLLQYGNYELELDTSYPIDELGTRSLASTKTTEATAWITLYPNPIDEFIAIRLNNAPTSSEANYVITDMTGRTIINGRLNSNNLEIIVNSTDLKAGSYILCIWDEGHLIHTEKLIKQ
jgi:hypothetical protein